MARRRFALLMSLLAAAPAGGQVMLEPIDQTIEDIASLAISLRTVEPGLQQPAGFSEVYRVPGRDDQFMRVQGALHAVFPKSVYAYDKKKGIYPVVPDGTVFHIGLPPPDPDARPQPARPAEAFPGRIDLRFRPAQALPVAAAVPLRPYDAMEDEPNAGRVINVPVRERPMMNRSRLRIVSDREYRTERLHELMIRAAQSVRRGRASDVLSE